MIRHINLVLCLVALFFSCVSHAQKDYFGLQGGLVQSSMLMKDWKQTVDPYDDKPNFKPIINLYFSFTYSRNVFGKMYMSTGLELYNKGSLMEVDSGYADITGGGAFVYDVKAIELLSYLHVPLTISRQIHVKKHRFTLHAGMGLSYLVEANNAGYMDIRERNALNNKDTTYRQRFEVKKSGYRPWDFSLHLGAGYQYRFNEDFAIGFEYRMSTNFVNINRTRLEYVVESPKNEGYFYLHSPIIKNKENHTFSLAIYLSPELFFGMVKKETEKPKEPQP